MRTKMCNIKINYLILQWTMRFPSSEATRKVLSGKQSYVSCATANSTGLFRCLTLLYFFLHIHALLDNIVNANAIFQVQKYTFSLNLTNKMLKKTLRFCMFSNIYHYLQKPPIFPRSISLSITSKV